ncbi:MAG: tRNA uridine-5-carboxymethylaminomethyl(34) synthesis GTPase MnmE [Ignavibacteriales bacterium]|nr:tRNA uridine-5-carboxymethylaminomethyl(34) synthesis GTPase MnmE [Ignavibacteriales bacterium]
MYLRNDTIAAIATPIGEGGISVIRISGKDAISIADKCFRGKQNLCDATSHTAHFGIFESQRSEPIDQVITTIFLQPNSYTGENVVEISCHGGMYISQKILEELIQSGVRAAEPGEFTFRAFANGKIDLAQAEAVADIIHSQSELSRNISLSQLQGKLSSKISYLREQLIHFCGLLELELDFSDEDIEFVSRDELTLKLQIIITTLVELIGSYETGRIYKEGAKIVLVGSPNVGKSSIFNTLLGENRAIVTNIPGTTRDKIEESIVIDGILFKIVDTAGLRDSDDFIELESFKKTKEEIQTADIIISVTDDLKRIDEQEKDIIDYLISKKKIIKVRNKIDLVNNRLEDCPENKDKSYINISALTGENIQLLKRAIIEKLFSGKKIDVNDTVIITNRRQHRCLSDACLIIKSVSDQLNQKISNEYLTAELRRGINILSEITGEITSDEIISNIFSNFCIGK